MSTSTTVSQKEAVASLMADLETATTELVECTDRETVARNATTDARNRVNAAQKRLDAKMKEVRALAPRDTDWKNETTTIAPRVS